LEKEMKIGKENKVDDEYDMTLLVLKKTIQCKTSAI